MNNKPMRGRIVSGSSCPCCSVWGETRASDKREWLKDAQEQVEDFCNYSNEGDVCNV